MPETIESFVQKLQAEGVQAGKQAAEKLLADTQAQAKRILDDANAKAEQTVAQAKQEAQRLADQQEHELGLAARDMVLRLREGVGAAISAVLQHEAAKALGNPDLLCKLIHDVIVEYAKEDARHEGIVAINVNKDAMAAVTDWALKYIGDDKEAGKAHLDLRGALKARGFEYSVGGYTVEVTPESIVEVLKQHAGERLREVLDRALANIPVQAQTK